MSEGQGRGHRRWEALDFGPWGAGDRVKLKGQDQTCTEEATLPGAGRRPEDGGGGCILTPEPRGLVTHSEPAGLGRAALCPQLSWS